jgi:uncharacterized protein (TIGR03790 family)
MMLCLLAGLLGARAFALGPHEILLLVNGESRDSVEVGETYARLRGVPVQNIVTLSLPEQAYNTRLRVTPAEFTELIWQPAIEAMERRGIRDHILAWTYSVDFPTRVAVEPMVSIQGLTFLRNRLPSPEAVKRGSYRSPLFAGPVNRHAEGYRSQTLESYSVLLRDNMPLPSMTLGFTRMSGNTKEEVLQCLRRGIQSDYTAPKGTVYFVTNKDIRSTARDWQFPAAVRALGRLGVKATSLSRMPSGKSDIMGLMTGAMIVDPGESNAYLPGSIGEHLTSWAGCFNMPAQTKLSVWIRAGAVASAGTVVEPYGNWHKFPNAWLFVHYASGCCVLESFYQSLYCPMQTIVVGDPLARPWAPRAEIELKGVGEGALSGVLELEAGAQSGAGHFSRYVYLVDGCVVGQGKRFSLDTRSMADGRHLLRVVGYRAGRVRNQEFLEKPINVANGGERTTTTDASTSEDVIMELISQP